MSLLALYRYRYRRPLIILGLILVISVLFVSYLVNLQASNTGPWHRAQKLTAYADFQTSKQEVTLHNIRDFRYNQDGSIASKLYRDSTYSLDQLERIWLGLSHFGPYGIAHSFLSFEFKSTAAGEPNQYLALSIEARLRPEQRYKPVIGLFRQYTKMNILATEQDVIGLRSHIRNERVLLYPLQNLSQTDQENLFLALMTDTNILQKEPAFYNTILDNCLTNILKHGGIHLNEISHTDLRVLLPGRVDRITYSIGISPNEMPFKEARLKATINPTKSQINDDNFSEKIRCGWNQYNNLHYSNCKNNKPL